MGLPFGRLLQNKRTRLMRRFSLMLMLLLMLGLVVLVFALRPQGQQDSLVESHRSFISNDFTPTVYAYLPAVLASYTSTVVIPSPSPTVVPSPSPTVVPSPPPGARPWTEVANWVYWLDGPDLTAIADTSYNLAVIDYSRNGGPQGEFTYNEIQTLRQNQGCKRRVLAYLSIGEAEDYRWYWQPAWTPGNPSWIVQEDPDWPGNYYVKFWETEWQSIVYAYLDRILAAGYDGVYLDRPDAIDQPYAQGHEQDMVEFVIAIARYARARSPLGQDFGVFPQNAEELGSHPEYLAAVTGIGIEELYYQATNLKVPENERVYREGVVNQFRLAPHGGLVLTVDYSNQSGQIDEAYARAATRGYVEYVADVDLAQVRINPGHEPVCR